MSHPPLRLERTIIHAAELRVAGLSWAQVAKRLRRKQSTISKWPTIYRAFWEAQVAAARQATAHEATDEAVAVLRSHLRDAPAKLSQDAARHILQHCDKADGSTKVPSISELHRLVDQLEEMTDEEFATLLALDPEEHADAQANLDVDASNPPCTA